MVLWLPVIGAWSFVVHLGGWGGIKRVARCTQIWGRGILFLWGIRLNISGDPSGFKGGLIVSNHLGYLDILVDAALFPIRFASKDDVRSWPVLGWYLGISRPVWIDRGNRTKAAEALEQFRETMRHGIPLLVYPEGTSTDGEHGLLPFKSTAFGAVCETKYPILPVLTRYRRGADGQSLAWFGSATLLPHVWRLLGEKKIVIDIHILPELTPLEGETRKQLAERVHTVMSEAYCRINGEAP